MASLHEPILSSRRHPVFYVGSARWRRSLDAIVTPLVPQLDAQMVSWTSFLANPYGLISRPVRARWSRWLQQAQEGQCFWCRGALSPPTTTVEHVLPYGETMWPTASRLEQLLSLRISHDTCNVAYAAWRKDQDPRRLIQMDHHLLTLIQKIVHQHPIFELYSYHQHHPPAG